jgi:hypothetical protein
MRLVLAWSNYQQRDVLARLQVAVNASIARALCADELSASMSMRLFRLPPWAVYYYL